MSVFVLKIIACTAMFLDHIKYANPLFNNFFTEYFGRLALPIFAFLIAEGYSHTSDLKKYIKRIFIFGVISQIPYMLFRTLVGDWKLLNVMFTLLLGLTTIIVYDNSRKKYFSIPIIITILVVGEYIKVEYGWFGILTVLVMHILRIKKMFMPLVYGIIIFVYYYSIIRSDFIFDKHCMLLMFFTWITTFIINLYNGEKGKSVKYFFYVFYPVHLLFIYLIHLI